jgi:hypothetical protein
MRTVESFQSSVNLRVSPNPLPWFNPTETLGRIKAFEEGYNINYIGVIESGILMSNISSLTVAPFPPIYPEDTDSEANTKFLQTERDYPKFCVEFYAWSSNDWVMVGKMILQNRNTIDYRNILKPYYTKSIALPISRNSQLGYRFRDVGNGLPTSNDVFSISYSWREEYYLTFKTTRSLKVSNNFSANVTNQSTKILDYAVGRKVIVIANKSPSNPAYLSFGKDAEFGKGIFLAPYGSYSWENTSYDLSLPIHAISDASISLSGIEIYA